MEALAARGRAGHEVTLAGTVTSEPTFFYGSHTHATHEEFGLRAADGSAYTVIDNVDIAPRVPVHPGDRVEVRGELVHDPGRPPIVHWTHHDPEGRHEDGYIILDGQRYARSRAAAP